MHVWVTAGSTTSVTISGAEIGEARSLSKPLQIRFLEAQVDNHFFHLSGRQLWNIICQQATYQALN